METRFQIDQKAISLLKKVRKDPLNPFNLCKVTAGDRIEILKANVDMALCLKVAGDTREAGSATVDLSSAGDVSVTATDAEVTLTTAQATATAVNHEYRIVDEPPLAPYHVDVDMPTLRRMIGAVIKATAKSDESRAIMTGILLDRINRSDYRAVATDGRRLAMADGRIICPNFTEEAIEHLQYQGPICIPAEFCKLILDVFNADATVAMAVEDNRVWFIGESGWASTHRLVGSFPNYRHILNRFAERQAKEQFVSVTFDAKAAAKALQPHVKNSDNTKPVTVLRLYSGELTSPDSKIGKIQNTLGVAPACPKYVGFNPAYLADVVKDQTGLVTLEMGNPEYATRFHRPDGSTYILMPVRLCQAAEAEEEAALADIAADFADFELETKVA